MSNLFQKLELEAFRKGINPRTRESREWFRKRVQRLTRVSREQLMKEPEVTRRATHSYGGMFMYFYDPKHKQTLPYYDGFPLIIMMGPAKGGFMGLNLHYLPPTVRARLLDTILGNSNAKIPEQYVAPAMKHYLFQHVKSRFALVDRPEWEIATFLPSADWNKAGPNKVYRDSRKKLRA